MASLLKKGGAGKSLPQGAAADAANAVQNAIGQLADKYGVDLDANAAAAKAAEEQKSESSNAGELLEAAAAEFHAENKRKASTRAPKFISQETFDMVVAENVDDFEMDPDEAVADAVEQFESQGIDLSNIVKSKDGAKAGPVPGLIAELEAAQDVPSACAVLDRLRAAVEASDDDRLIAGSNDACGAVFGTVGRVDRESRALMVAALRCFASLSAFGTRGRLVIPLYPLAKPVLKMIFSTTALVDRNLWALACRVARQACARNEAAKHSLFLEYGFDGFVRTAMRRGLGWGSAAAMMTGASAAKVRPVAEAAQREWEAKCADAAAAGAEANAAPAAAASEDASGPDTTSEFVPHASLLREACLLCTTLLIDDDRREGVQPMTFGRARQLGDGKKIATALIGEVVACLERAGAIAGDALTAEAGAASEGAASSTSSQQSDAARFAADVATTVRALAVTDEICADFTERGATSLLIEIINVHLDTARTVAKACLALKMISNNDANKRTLVLSGGLDAVLRAMAQHSTVVDVQSQCLATLSSLGLRQPDNCVAIVAKHGVDLILSAMQRLPGSVQVQRSGCLALRNLVARNKEHVDIILGAGAEDVLRAARARHLDCNDVAFSALRDLGCQAQYRKTSDLAKGIDRTAKKADARKGPSRA